MGKDSLIKSTTKKSGKKKDSKKSAPTKASATKGKKGTRPQPETSRVSDRPKPTEKDLLFKQFVSRQSPGPLPLPDYSKMTAPALIDSNDPAEVDRLRSLLSKTFDMEAIKAAAKEPEAVVDGSDSDPTTPSSSDTKQSEPEQEPAPIADQIAQAPPIDQLSADEQTAQPAEPAAAAEIPPEVQAAEPAPMADQIAQAPPIDQVRADEQTEQTSANGTSESHREIGDDTGATSPPSGFDGSSDDPVKRFAKMGAIALALLIILIVWASISNSFRYFIVPKSASVEIWRGDFSPAGRKFVAVLHGVRSDEPLKSSYRRQEVYPMIFSYYIERADGLLEVDGLPDFQAIHDYLQRAGGFAINTEMHNAVEVRRKNIQRLSLLYKADLDISRGTTESLQAALQSLKQARQLTSDPMLFQIIDQRIALASENLATMKAESKSAK